MRRRKGYSISINRLIEKIGRYDEDATVGDIANEAEKEDLLEGYYAAKLIQRTQ